MPIKLNTLLSSAMVYQFVQNFLGAPRALSSFSDRFLVGLEGKSVLDIGCGTAGILAHLPESIDYLGVDPSERYIDFAKKNKSPRARFLRLSVEEMTGNALGEFDYVLALGVLHHLDDATAAVLANVAGSNLKQEGKLVTLDPCFSADQPLISHLLVASDRGEYVRKPGEYLNIVEPFFNDLRQYVCDDLMRVPYSHFVMIGSDFS